MNLKVDKARYILKQSTFATWLANASEISLANTLNRPQCVHLLMLGGLLSIANGTNASHQTRSSWACLGQSRGVSFIHLSIRTDLIQDAIDCKTVRQEVCKLNTGMIVWKGNVGMIASAVATGS